MRHSESCLLQRDCHNQERHDFRRCPMFSRRRYNKSRHLTTAGGRVTSIAVKGCPTASNEISSPLFPTHLVEESAKEWAAHVLAGAKCLRGVSVDMR
jgi:hypothetical protein